MAAEEEMLDLKVMSVSLPSISLTVGAFDILQSLCHYCCRWTTQSHGQQIVQSAISYSQNRALEQIDNS